METRIDINVLFFITKGIATLFVPISLAQYLSIFHALLLVASYLEANSSCQLCTLAPNSSVSGLAMPSSTYIEAIAFINTSSPLSSTPSLPSSFFNIHATSL